MVRNPAGINHYGLGHHLASYPMQGDRNQIRCISLAQDRWLTIPIESP